MKGKRVIFDATICRFGKQGEKTGWQYIEIPVLIAQQLFPGNKKSFRVSGTIDQYVIDKTALIPMGEGNFILPLNSAIRKGIGKKESQNVTLKIKHDARELEMDPDLVMCLAEDPVANNVFSKLTPGHRNYFSKWIASAKTDVTKAKRIAMTLEAMIKGWDYSQMLRNKK